MIGKDMVNDQKVVKQMSLLGLNPGIGISFSILFCQVETQNLCHCKNFSEILSTLLGIIFFTQQFVVTYYLK
jgi:hypothetical protein